MSTSLDFVHFFDAAHQLTDSEDLVTKKCAQLHGHTYAVKLNGLRRKKDSGLNGAGMVIDFSALKQTIDILDHRFINEVFSELGISTTEPTAEAIARFIYGLITAKYPDLDIDSVQVCEGFKGWERANWAVFTPACG